MKYKKDYTGIAFFDIDGVLANCKHRLHFNEEKDYDNFYSDENILSDTLIKSGAILRKMFEDAGYKITFITNRRNECREATWRWLQAHKLITNKNTELYMRGFGDYRKSWDVKKDLLINAIEDNMDLYLKENNYFIDDYPENCMMVEENFANIKPIIFGCGRLKSC